MSIIHLENIRKSYIMGKNELQVLKGISLDISKNEYVALMGPSGSGKSTLMNILGCLDQPTTGTYILDGEDVGSLNDDQLANIRNRKVGFLFQDHCLLPQCSVLENVLIPTLVSKDRAAYPKRARELLEQVGLGERMEHRPSELSGGEKQRAALARALILQPVLLLCDEPTGNLDEASAGVVADLLLELHRRQETILIVVTHSAELAARFPQRYELRHADLHPAGA